MRSFKSLQRESGSVLSQEQELDISFLNNSPGCKQTKARSLLSVKARIASRQIVICFECEIKDHIRSQKVNFPQIPLKKLFRDALRREDK